MYLKQQNQNVRIANESFENVEKFEYLRTTPTNQNDIHDNLYSSPNIVRVIKSRRMRFPSVSPSECWHSTLKYAMSTFFQICHLLTIHDNFPTSLHAV